MTNGFKEESVADEKIHLTLFSFEGTKGPSKKNKNGYLLNKSDAWVGDLIW